MAQVGWVYLDDFGNQHRIGVYHGDRSGHLLIHCNRKVVQVDFSVKESRKYSFFIEDELCEIGIFKEKSGFTYDFQVNKKVDTPRNRLRRADERRNRRDIGLFVTGLVVLITVAVLGFQWYGRSQRQKFQDPITMHSRLKPEYERRMAVEGKQAIAELSMIEETLHRRVFYTFRTESNRQISGLFSVPDTGIILLPNGFPLENRDAFGVTYLLSEPQIHRLDFSRPSDQTLAAYLQRALKAEQQAHPNASDAHSRCIARQTLSEKGWEHLADLIFQSTAPEKNPDHNRDSYLRLVRDAGFAKVLSQKCWDQ